MNRYNVTVKFCAEDESVPALGADSKGRWGPWAEEKLNMSEQVITLY